MHFANKDKPSIYHKWPWYLIIEHLVHGFNFDARDIQHIVLHKLLSCR